MVQYNGRSYSMLQNYIELHFLCDKFVNSRGKQIIITFFYLNSFHNGLLAV